MSSNFLLDKGRWPKTCKKSVFVILIYLLLPYGGTISTILFCIGLTVTLVFGGIVAKVKVNILTVNEFWSRFL